MTNNLNKGSINDIPITLSSIIPEQKLLLRGVSPCYKYDNDGNKTNEIAGYKYDCVGMRDFCHMSIKVEQSNPVITDIELEHRRMAGENVFVSVDFDKTLFKIYSIYKGVFSATIKAENISIEDDTPDLFG